MTGCGPAASTRSPAGIRARRLPSFRGGPDAESRARAPHAPRSLPGRRRGEKVAPKPFVIPDESARTVPHVGRQSASERSDVRPFRRDGLRRSGREEGARRPHRTRPDRAAAEGQGLRCDGGRHPPSTSSARPPVHNRQPDGRCPTGGTFDLWSADRASSTSRTIPHGPRFLGSASRRWWPVLDAEPAPSLPHVLPAGRGRHFRTVRPARTTTWTPRTYNLRTYLDPACPPAASDSGSTGLRLLLPSVAVLFWMTRHRLLHPGRPPSVKAPSRVPTRGWTPWSRRHAVGKTIVLPQREVKT